MRRTRDLAYRATVMAGMGLIVGLLVLAVALIGMDGMRENMKIVAGASGTDLQDAGEAALDEGRIGLQEATRVAERLPDVELGEFKAPGGD